MKRAFLHIGLPKTGTTYLQNVLWQNKTALARDGLLLPGSAHRKHLLASVEVRESPRLAKRAGPRATPWGDLVGEMTGWAGDVLVTHEFFCAASPEQVRRMVDDLSGFEVHVVVTARPMTALALSRWQEWVKNGGRRGVDRYPTTDEYDPADDWGWGSFDLADVLERWSSVIEPSRIHVIVVGDRRDPPQLWRRFARVLGIDPDRYVVEEAPRNESLGLVEIELLRRINAKLEGFRSAADRGIWIRSFLGEGDILARRPERFRAGAERLALFEAKDRRAVDLLRSGGFDIDGDPAELLQPAETEALRHPSQVTDAELVDSATTAIAHLLAHVRELSRHEPLPPAVAAGRRVRSWLERLTGRLHRSG